MKQFFFFLFLTGFTATVFSQNYVPVDNGSKVKFNIKNFGINTGGTFEGLTGSIVFDAANPAAASFSVMVDAKTVDTDNGGRDNHLRKSEYFDVEKYPKLSFISTKITKTNTEGYLYMFGKLTIKGVIKEISFPFKATAKDGGYLFEGSFKVNRRDFGVGSSSVSLSDNLNVTLSIFGKKN
jgi:polyisoprenoid-binding protein YceI